MAIRDIHMPQCASLCDSIIGISDRFILFTDKTSVRTFTFVDPIGCFPEEVFARLIFDFCFRHSVFGTHMVIAAASIFLRFRWA